MQYRPRPNFFPIFTTTKNKQVTGNGTSTSKGARKGDLPVPNAALMGFIMNGPWSRGVSSYLGTLNPSKAA